MMNREDSTEILSSINVPTLFIFGEEDKLTGIDIATSMKEKVSNNLSQLEIIKDAGNLSFYS